MFVSRITTALAQPGHAHSWLRRLLVATVIVALALTFTPSAIWTKHRPKANDEHDHDLHKIFQGPPGEDRCSEEDGEKISNCPCLDPLVPKARVESAVWMEHHRVMTEEVKAVKDVDVVLIGDSLVEGWRGTKALGSISADEHRAVFDTYFNRTAGGNVSGLALGSSGDVTPHTLWHLQNGLIPKTLKPKLFYLLIGTNDLQARCSKKSVLVGILNIADCLHRLRPNVPILFHGLLPRTGPEEDADSNNKLGQHWKKIMWINRELKMFAKMHKNWYYMDSAAIFLERDRQTGDVVLKRELMPDGLHPNLEGYQHWGKRILEDVKKILEKKHSA